MVFIINSKQYQPSKYLMNKHKVIKYTSQPFVEKPDPIMTNIQKDTTVNELQSNSSDNSNSGDLYGQGFKVHGGKCKSTNHKLRKFISLNLK